MKPPHLTKDCLFCWAPLHGERAKEHVVPQWYLSWKGIQKKKLEVLQLDDKFVEVGRRSLGLGSFVAGKVCAACNGGWMSTLEGRARPIIEPLVDGHGRIAALSLDEREILAKWACKTAYALDATTMGKRSVPPKHSRSLTPKYDRLPNGVIVVGAKSPFSEPAEFIEAKAWNITDVPGGPESRRSVAAACSYKTVIHLGHLVMLVAYWPGTDYLYCLDPEVHERIWVTDGTEGFVGTSLPAKTVDGYGFRWHFASTLGMVSARIDPATSARPLTRLRH